MHEDEDEGAPDADLGDLDPDAWVWLPGVDYLPGWRAAQVEAGRLNAALAGADIRRQELRAVASTLADGSGRVQLVGTVLGARKLAQVLEEIIRWRGAA